MNMKVEFSGKRKFTIKIREHEITTDLPEKQGGDNTAPTPTELFVSSLGACVGLYVSRYLETAKLDPSGLSINMDWDFSENKKKVGYVNFSISAPKAVLGQRKRAVLLAAEQCLVHNTLRDNPDMRISVEGE